MQWVAYMISRAALVSVQGRASCPSTNNVRPIFQGGGGVFKSVVSPKAVGSFFVEGHKALPCTGYIVRKGCAGYIGLSDLGGLARENISQVMRFSHAVYPLAKARRTQRNVRQILSYPK
jgi:hypothetical protein